MQLNCENMYMYFQMNLILYFNDLICWSVVFYSKFSWKIVLEVPNISEMID